MWIVRRPTYQCLEFGTCKYTFERESRHIPKGCGRCNEFPHRRTDSQRSAQHIRAQITHTHTVTSSKAQAKFSRECHRGPDISLFKLRAGTSSSTISFKFERLTNAIWSSEVRKSVQKNTDRIAATFPRRAASQQRIATRTAPTHPQIRPRRLPTGIYIRSVPGTSSRIVHAPGQHDITRGLYVLCAYVTATSTAKRPKRRDQAAGGWAVWEGIRIAWLVRNTGSLVDRAPRRRPAEQSRKGMQRRW
ncbi:hypothetical protein C8Q77DRAFT_220106 [Trametes polyzona]|nr:hypothetical protein C8Q77DRAFT_220106 [Trametes polyzona]